MMHDTLDRTFLEDVQDEHYEEYNDATDTHALKLASNILNDDNNTSSNRSISSSVDRTTANEDEEKYGHNSMIPYDENPADNKGCLEVDSTNISSIGHSFIDSEDEDKKDSVNSSSRKSVSFLIDQFQTTSSPARSRTSTHPPPFSSTIYHDTRKNSSPIHQDQIGSARSSQIRNEDSRRTQNASKETKRSMLQSTLPILSMSISSKREANDAECSSDQGPCHTTDFSIPMDPEIGRLINDIEEQLTSSAMIPDPSLSKKPKGNRPEPFDTDFAESLYDGREEDNDDDDDDLAFEMQQLSSSQNELMNMLDLNTPALTPEFPPAMTDDSNDKEPQVQVFAESGPIATRAQFHHVRYDSTFVSEPPRDSSFALSRADVSAGNCNQQYNDPDLIIDMSSSPESGGSTGPTTMSPLSDEDTAESGLLAVGSSGDGTFTTVEHSFGVRPKSSGQPGRTLNASFPDENTTQVGQESSYSFDSIPNAMTSRTGDKSLRSFNTGTITPVRNNKNMNFTVSEQSDIDFDVKNQAGKVVTAFHDIIDTLDDSPEPPVPFAPDEWDYHDEEDTSNALSSITEKSHAAKKMTGNVYDDDDTVDAFVRELESEIVSGNHNSNTVSSAAVPTTNQQPSNDLHIKQRPYGDLFIQPWSAAATKNRIHWLGGFDQVRVEKETSSRISCDVSARAKKVDAWDIKSRADGKTDAMTLNAALIDIRKDSSERRLEPNLAERELSQMQCFSSEAGCTDDFDVEGQTNGEVEDSCLQSMIKREVKAKHGRRQWFLCWLVCIAWVLFVGVVIGLALLLGPEPDTRISGEASTNDAPTDIRKPTVAPALQATPAPTLATTLPSAESRAPSLSPVQMPASSPQLGRPTFLPSDVIMSPSSAPTSAPVTVTTVRPTDLPTSFPTALLPPSIPVTKSALALIELLVSESLDGGTSLLNQTTSEYQALVWLLQNQFLDTYSDRQKIQRFVLATVYYSMNGDSWLNNSLWLTDTDECQWYSRSRNAVCNQNGDILNLELGYLDVSGTIPEALGMLSNSLERLDIEGGPRATVKGTIPTELGLLSLMRATRISGNSLSGTIPFHLRRWIFLETLDLHDNNLSGRLTFDHGFWTGLSTLDLSENSFTGTLTAQIGRMSRLTTLFLQDNNLDGALPSQIGKLLSLRHLNLNQNSFVSFPSEVGRLQELETFLMAANTLQNTLPTEIGLLSNLRKSRFLAHMSLHLSHRLG